MKIVFILIVFSIIYKSISLVPSSCPNIKECKDCVQAECLFAIFEKGESCIAPRKLFVIAKVTMTIQSAKRCDRHEKRKSTKALSTWQNRRNYSKRV